MKTCVGAVVTLCLLAFCAGLAGAEASSTSSEKTTANKQAKRNAVTEAEIGSFSCETSDQFFGRVSRVLRARDRQFSVKGSVTLAKNYTFGKNPRTARTNSFTLNMQHRVTKQGYYKFVQANGSVKRKGNSGSDKVTNGYYVFGIGMGKSVSPGVECEIGLGAVHVYVGESDDFGSELTPIYTFRTKRDVAPTMVLNADTMFVRPFAEGTVVDSSVSLTYKLNQQLGVRLTYMANNVQNSSYSREGWDKSLRLSFLFKDSGG